MKALDLFCCSGGTSVGLNNAGFEVEGVDINPELSKYYPYKIKYKNVFDLERDYLNSFDFIWASPPCQAYSEGTVKWRKGGKEYPDLIAKTRDLLNDVKLPYVIENVVGAPIRRDLLLCGEMFDLKVIRHRIFEVYGFMIPQPIHKKHKGTVWHGEYVGVWKGGTPGCFGNEEHRKYFEENVNNSLKTWQEAMGINWIEDKFALSEAIPPAYSEYIGRGFLKSPEKETSLEEW